MIPSVTIVIPTYNCAAMLPQAIDAALGQSHPVTKVMVVDDGSTDDTGGVIARYSGHPRFTGVCLERNAGTAQAKNVGLSLSISDAVTFHDSDDVPHRDKVLRQARVIGNQRIGAHPCLNWNLTGREPGSRIQVGGVLTHHELILPDGERVEVRRALSLVDDFFPNLQMGTAVMGDWTHVNSGLFHRSVFDRWGGFADCIEEDREFRNRLIMGGEVLWVIPEVLLTKIETPGSLTQQGDTDYGSARRIGDRKKVWNAVERWFATRDVDPVPINLTGVHVRSCTNPKLCNPAVLRDLTVSVREEVA